MKTTWRRDLGLVWFAYEFSLARMGGDWLPLARPNAYRSLVFGCSHEDRLHKIIYI